MRAFSIVGVATTAFVLTTSSSSANPAVGRPARSFPVVAASFEPTFELNGRRADGDVLYLSRGNGYTLLLGANGAVLDLGCPSSARVTMRFAGGAKLAKPEPIGLLPAKSHYYIGAD